MTYQASPYTMQSPNTPSWADAVADQRGFHPIAGSSSRGAILERAFSLTRSGPRSAANHQTSYYNHQQHPSRVEPGSGSPQQRKGSDAQSANRSHLAQYHARHQGQGQQTLDERRKDARGSRAIEEYTPHTMSPLARHISPDQSPLQSSSEARRQRVQDQRTMRLSQQRLSGIQLGEPQPEHRSPTGGTASNHQFANSRTIASPRSDLNSYSQEAYHHHSSPSASSNHFSEASPHIAPPMNAIADDADRIAAEVRGLALRRRHSMDTVRSSEFGEGGRWAKAWGSSDDEMDDEDDDDDDEDEDAYLRSFASTNVGDFDIEQPPSLGSGHGALGQLSNIHAAHAAMTAGVPNPPSAHELPPLQSVSNAEHVVSLTNSQQDRLRMPNVPPRQPSPSGSRSNLNPSDATTHDRKRDTITSMLGEVGEYAASSGRRSHQHVVNDSMSSGSGSSNSHVKVWPPTPSAFASARRGEGAYAGLNARIAAGKNHQVHLERQAAPSAPLAPSAVLAMPHDEPILGLSISTAPAKQSSQASAPLQSQGYSDPNMPPTYFNALDSLGDARRRAIADHDGRESMVSDLDVETLRLDGSSASDDSDVWRETQRDSTSTIGTVSSAVVEEQRRRRSQMEEREMSARRAGAGVNLKQNEQRYAPSARSPHFQGQSQPSSQNTPASRRITSYMNPMDLRLEQSGNRPSAPRRSNTLPEEQQQSPYTVPGSAPWTKQGQNVHSPVSPQAYLPRHQGEPLTPSTRNANLASMPSPSLRSTSLTASSSMTSTGTQDRSSLTTSTKRTSGTGASTGPNSQAEKFLSLGISHHESGDLSRSAYYFERSAKVDGGCVVGMCMWGMALREGWGVRKDQKKGFDWISRAASRAGEMMSSASAAAKNHGTAPRSEAEVKAIRSELKLSVYELGKCFCYGWGVKLDKQMALEYFELAAKLGDADAQAEAGALLAAGKGCKKDLKKAAMYYRMAEAQGYDTVGLSWIHKDKYDPVKAK